MYPNFPFVALTLVQPFFSIVVDVSLSCTKYIVSPLCKLSIFFDHVVGLYFISVLFDTTACTAFLLSESIVIILLFSLYFKS